MTTYNIRPAVRENTPLVIGIAGPTKSGKTYSALRLARGLSPTKPIVMLNAEGPRGHQYADKFKYLTLDLEPPYRYGIYEAALKATLGQDPGAVIIDSVSHAHDGPGGFLEWHEDELDRIAGKTDQKARDRANFTAWIKPKAAENSFRYAVLGMPCPVILCMRAKEKIKIVPGAQPIDLGWQPIVGESIAFETIFTVTLPPNSKGVPDLAISGMREPFDTMIPKGKPIDEELGKMLVEWAKGQAAAVVTTLLGVIQETLMSRYSGKTPADREAKNMLVEQAFGTRSWSKVQGMDEAALRAGIEKLQAPAVASSSTPAPTQAKTPTDPPKASLFPTAAQLKAPTKPAAAVTGVDVPDEAQTLEQQIETQKAKLERQPPDEVWSKICQHVTGTTVLDMADPDALERLLLLVKGLVSGDEGALEAVNEIVGA